MLGALPATFPIFQWHDDTFSLPGGAEHLASNAVAENQAFRIGRATYGIQFHFEADRPLVREWNTAFAPYIAERHPDWPGRFESGGGAPRSGRRRCRPRHRPCLGQDDLIGLSAIVAYRPRL